MRHLIATAGLGPLLLVQGRHVRAVTPRLPEPSGPRSGRAGQGAPLRLLVAGDSAAPRAVLFTALPPMHLFPALPQPLRWYLGARALDFNAALADWLPRYPGRHLSAPEFQPDPQYIASDGFHPGPAAYRAWAARVACDIDRLFPV
jgi:hypothetical protein